MRSEDWSLVDVFAGQVSYSTVSRSRDHAHMNLSTIKREPGRNRLSLWDAHPVTTESAPSVATFNGGINRSMSFKDQTRSTRPIPERVCTM